MTSLSHKSLGRENIWFHSVQVVVQSCVEIQSAYKRVYCAFTIQSLLWFCLGQSNFLFLVVEFCVMLRLLETLKGSGLRVGKSCAPVKILKLIEDLSFFVVLFILDYHWISFHIYTVSYCCLHSVLEWNLKILKAGASITRNLLEETSWWC